MQVSYVLRLRTDQLAQGRFGGEIEGVATGRRHGVSSLEQLAAFLIQSAASERRAAIEAIEKMEMEGLSTQPW